MRLTEVIQSTNLAADEVQARDSDIVRGLEQRETLPYLIQPLCEKYTTNWYWLRKCDDAATDLSQ